MASGFIKQKLIILFLHNFRNTNIIGLNCISNYSVKWKVLNKRLQGHRYIT